MAHQGDITAWIALFSGLFSLAAGVGEMRSPNGWHTMVKEAERSPALRYMMGLFSLTLGAVIYLVNPWDTGDWLSIAVSLLGGIAVAEGLLILASGERFLHFGRAMLGRGSQGWAGFAMLFGVGAVLAALSRLGVG